MTQIRSSDTECIRNDITFHTGNATSVLGVCNCDITPSITPGLRPWQRRRGCLRVANTFYSSALNWPGYCQLVDNLHYYVANSRGGAWAEPCAVIHHIQPSPKFSYLCNKDRGYSIFSMLLIWLLVAVIVPWQVAFLVCWIIHLVTCATYVAPASGDVTTPHSLIVTRDSLAPPSSSRNDVDHVLLLLTWLLPLTAPVLSVWVRTLATAGPIALGSPGMGDHNFLPVAPYLVLVEYASRRRDPLLLRHK